MKALKFSVLCLALLGGSAAYASDEGKCTEKCATESKACPVSEGLAKLPKLVYKVGDKEACCENSAKSLAASTGKPIVYVVGKDSFDCPNKAFASLVEQTEKYVADYSTPHTCSVSGKTTIAGESMACSVAAGEVAAKLKKAMDSLAISYKVGEKNCSCPVEAKALVAAKKDAKMIYVVDNQETECELTARLNLARAKYKAALLAMNPAKETPAQSTKIEAVK